MRQKDYDTLLINRIRVRFEVQSSINQTAGKYL